MNERLIQSQKEICLNNQKSTANLDKLKKGKQDKISHCESKYTNQASKQKKMKKRNCNQNDSEIEASERSLPQCLTRCPVHKIQFLNDISLEDCESGLVFKCNKCKKSDQNVDINEIALSDDNCIFENYPKLPEDLRQKIMDIFQSKESKENMVDKVKCYYKNLKIKILQSISDMEEEMTIKAQEIDSFQTNLKKEYNELSRKTELREILFDDSNINNKSDSVKIIVQEVMKNSNEIEQKLMEMINNFNQANENINSQNLDENSYQKIESILKSMKKKEVQDISKIIYDQQVKYFFESSIKEEKINDIENETIKDSIENKEIQNSEKDCDLIKQIDQSNLKPQKYSNKKSIKLGKEVFDKIFDIISIKTQRGIQLGISESSIDYDGDEGAYHQSNDIAQLKNITSLDLILEQDAQ